MDDAISLPILSRGVRARHTKMSVVHEEAAGARVVKLTAVVALVGLLVVPNCVKTSTRKLDRLAKVSNLRHRGKV